MQLGANQPLRISPSNEGARANMPWYVVLSKPRCETIARENLVRQGYAVYLPRLKVLKRSRGRQETKLEPLFPRYLFVQPSLSEQSISPVLSTHGVTTLVRFGFTLAVLQPETFSKLREFEAWQSEGNLGVVSPFQPGIKVTVTDGPLVGLEGLIFCTSQEKIVVLMRILGKDTPVSISHHQLRVA